MRPAIAAIDPCEKLSSRRYFEPGSTLIFAKVKMGPGQEAYTGDIHFLIQCT